MSARRFAYSNDAASFDTALKELVKRCRRDWLEIQYFRGALKERLAKGAAVHGIDPAAVRRLLKMDDNDEIKYARQEEINQAYQAIVKGDTPTIPKRADTELDKVMTLVTNDKPPKINDIMKAISCSRGKAHKLRNLAATRLAAKSSRSSKTRELELSSRDVHVKASHLVDNAVEGQGAMEMAT